jgi:hypothetical protein
MAEQAGAADSQTKEIVQQIARFAERDAKMSSAIAGEQSRSRADVSARQFQVAATLTGSRTDAAAVDVSTIAMPFEFGLGDIGNDVIVELSGRLELVTAAMLTLLGMNIMFDELGIGRRLGPKDTGMLAMLLSSLIVGCTLARLALVLGAFASL